MSARRKGRELALQVLYQRDLGGESPRRDLSAFGERFEVSAQAREFAWQLVCGVEQRRVELDEAVAAASQHWRLDRLARIDANVIRIALYEMTTGLPLEIAINEAVEVARKYGTAESPAFVNGVLDAVSRRLGLPRGQGQGT
jgi:N utilization substance protein B